MKKKQIIQTLFILIIAAGIIAITYMPEPAKSEPTKTPPTVFVHGYKGTYNSFGNMLERFEKHGWGNKALVYYVSQDGKIREYNLNKGKREPILIQVIFANNRASFDDTSAWLASVLQHMKVTYEIDSINLVGHSMGGLVSLKYLEENHDADLYPVTKKLVTIGSPFDGIYSDYYFTINRDAAATDLKPNSAALKLLRLNNKKISDNVSVLSIGSTGDYVAEPESVKALRMIIPDNQLMEKMIENANLGHSELHESEHVDRLIHSFLWQEQEE
ncbi:alpha/beta hydrolase [Virgibacillus ndiopensis]|uniref:alpha/beta hydrolase n=1 Tax=Virgibacillus ndiopensis TaxID=2004408 RepID=UPI001FE4CFE9|nr:alpha/beta hydrolase [Virgibacillus ndiopensis]